MISITDTGTGISESLKLEMFTPFFSTKLTSDGTGLGLSNCHEVISETNGTVHVRSTPGCGAEYRIYLPLAE